MKGIKLGAALPELESWGTVANLGSSLIQGEANAQGLVHFGTPTSPQSAGYFACTKGKFDMEYPFHEHATVLEGEVTLSNRKTGESIHFKSGDSWFIEKGTQISWDVHSERFVKHYFAVV
jgi:uncharacterized cupin superfamily protein